MGEGTQECPVTNTKVSEDLPGVHTALLTPAEETTPPTEAQPDTALLSSHGKPVEQPRPPSTLNTDCFSSSSSLTRQNFSHYPDSPVVCTIPGHSQLSTPSNSPALYRHLPIGPYLSNTNLSEERFVCGEKLHGFHYGIAPCPPYTNLHLPSPVANTSNIGMVESSSMVIPSFSLDTKSNLSDSLSTMLPFCRICHMPGDESEVLISPCRCSGSMQYIHNTCLMKWLEITSKHTRKPPRCELCHFQFHRHKKFKFNQFRCPRTSRQDRVLHAIFLFMIVLMIGCAIATVMCFLSDKGQINKLPRNKVDLTTEEIITLSCGVLFFVSFFVAMSVQIKAKHTVYQLFLKFILQNMEWEIDEYDKYKDALYLEKHVPRNINPKSFNIPPAYV